MEFDLVLTAGLGDNLHEINSPILRIPHGNGYKKKWNTGTQEVFGLSDGTLEHQGRLVPTSIALSHHEQFDRLRDGCPDAPPLAFLTGDPCYDRLLASAPRRLNYRKDLGLRPGRKLIVVNSTWKTDSLFGIDPAFVPRLLAQLPYDEFRIALVLHPNVWSAHSKRQIEVWHAEALRSGLQLIPPDEGRRAAITAAPRPGHRTHLTVGHRHPDRGGCSPYSGSPPPCTRPEQESLSAPTPSSTTASPGPPTS